MKKYRIFKGCHYSNFLPSFHKVQNDFGISTNVIFDESCKYEIDEKSCVNKLFGFCFGFGVHKNSVRFGWTYNNEKNSIVIWKYIYSNKKLFKEKIYSCEIGMIHKYQLYLIRQDSYYKVGFYIDNQFVCSDKLKSDSCFITTLGPYFGGNTRAPHKITINFLDR